MALDVAEWTLTNIIAQGITTVQQDAATQVPILFPQTSSTLQQQIITSLTTGNLKTVAVQLAYLPNTTPTLPGVWLYGTPGGEETGHDVIGSVWTYAPDSQGLDSDQGIMSRKSWQCTIATTNVTDLLVLVALVKWSLIGARHQLGEPPNAFIEQTLNWSGWGPMANSAGDVVFPYQQTLTFTVTVVETAQTTITQTITGTNPSVLLKGSD